MDFNLTDEQQMLLESVDEFCERYFTEDVVKKMYEDHGMPQEIAEAYRDAGFGLMGIPEEYGLMIERLYQKSGCMHILYQNSLSMFDIMEFGTEAQKQEAMDHYMETGWPIASLSISEPGAGSDNRSMTTVAKKQADGTYKLSGQKTWVTMGEKLPYTIVVAKDEDPSHDNGNMSLWFVKMDTPGVLHRSAAQDRPAVHPVLRGVPGRRRPHRGSAHGRAGQGLHDAHEELRGRAFLHRRRAGRPGSGSSRGRRQVR